MSADPSCSTTTGPSRGSGGSSDSSGGAAVARAVHASFKGENVWRGAYLLHILIRRRVQPILQRFTRCLERVPCRSSSYTYRFISGSMRWCICYEAQARLRDPVYGCVAHIFALQQQAVNLRAELSNVQGHLTTLELPTPPPGPPSQSLLTTPPLSISDLPAASCMPATYDLSPLFDPMEQTTWTILQPQQRQLNPRQFGGGGGAPTGILVPCGGGDLQELARELLQRHGSPSQPCSALPPHFR